MESDFVRDEAERGRQRNVYVGAVFDDINPRNLPVPFSSLSTADLSDWIETGSKVTHPGWRSVLNALGGLLDRPLLKAAEAFEVKNSQTKLQFIKNYSNDPIAARLSDEIKTAKREEFDRRMDEAKAQLNTRLDEINQKLELIRNDFDNRLLDATDLAITDPRKIIEGMLKPSNNKEIDIVKLEARASSAERELTHARRIIAKLESGDGAFGSGRKKLAWIVATSILACLALGLLYFTFRLNHDLQRALADSDRLSTTVSSNGTATERVAALEKAELAREVTQLKQELQTTKASMIALDRDKASLSSQLTQAQKDLQSTKADLSQARSQFEDAKKENAALADQMMELQRKNEDLRKRPGAPQTSLENPVANAASTEAERRCYQLGIRPLDVDRPENVRPASSVDSANADQIINTCTEALSSIGSQETRRRRILLYLGRGHLLRAFAARRSDPANATSEFDNAVSRFQTSSVAGSVDANWMLGWIFHGGVNRDKYKLVGTPEYKRAWENIKRAAEGKHPLGLAAAGIYQIWPQCFPASGAPSNISKGLEYLRQASNLNVMQAVFVEGYASYYGVGTGRSDPRGLDAMKRAAKDLAEKDVNDEAQKFLKNLPSKPSCPPDVLH
jgi:TPR repeat protein